MSEVKGVVSWRMAETALLEAMELALAQPDRERAFLSAGSRSCWPQIVRDVQADYADAEARPRRQLTRRDMMVLGRMLDDPDAAALAVPTWRRRLVGRVLMAKLDGRGEGFTWQRIWEAEDRAARRAGLARPASAEALRKAYASAVGKVAERMTEMGFAG